MLIRRLFIVILSVIVAACCTGCGVKTDVEQSQPSQSAEAMPTETIEAASTPEPTEIVAPETSSSKYDLDPMKARSNGVIGEKASIFDNDPAYERYDVSEESCFYRTNTEFCGREDAIFTLFCDNGKVTGYDYQISQMNGATDYFASSLIVGLFTNIQRQLIDENGAPKEYADDRTEPYEVSDITPAYVSEETGFQDFDVRWDGIFLHLETSLIGNDTRHSLLSISYYG